MGIGRPPVESISAELLRFVLFAHKLQPRQAGASCPAVKLVSVIDPVNGVAANDLFAGRGYDRGRSGSRVSGFSCCLCRSEELASKRRENYYIFITIIWSERTERKRGRHSGCRVLARRAN